MMREEQPDGVPGSAAWDKENIDPGSGALSPRQRKKGSLRASVLKELVMRSSRESVSTSAEEMLDEDISAVFEKLDDSQVFRRDFREL